MRNEKRFLVTEIQEHLKNSSSFLITSYQRMDPNLAFALRTSIIETGGAFQVVKKRIFLKAATEFGISMDKGSLNGHIGIVYVTKDLIATTKTVYKFRKDNRDLLEVVGGFSEGKMCSPQEFEEISQLSSQEQMRAEFLGLIEGVMAGIPGTMEALLGSIISYIDQKRSQQKS